MDFQVRSPATADLEAWPARSTGSSETRLKMEDLPDSQEGLMGMLENLEEQKKAVLFALSKKDKPFTVLKPTVQDITVVFVEEIEKANQFFEFERYLKEPNVVKPELDAVENLKNLVKVQQVQEDMRFNKLDFEQIMNAVEYYIVDLKKRSRHKQSIQGNNSCEVSSEEGNGWYSLMSLKESGFAQLIDPFLSLVYHIREKGHVMDEDPLLELGYIKKYDKSCYRRCILRRLLRKFSERQVTALFIPPHYEENDVKEAFSHYGNVVSVELESCENTADVTFEDSVAARLATAIMTRTSGLYIYPTFEKHEYQPKSITQYEEAMIKYEEYRNYSKKSQTEPVQTPDKGMFNEKRKGKQRE